MSKFASAELLPSGGDFHLISCEPLGGVYKLSGTAKELLQNLSPVGLAKVSTWVVDQHRLGVEVPEVSSDVLRGIRVQRKIGLSDRVHRLYRFLASKLERIGNSIPWQARSYGIYALTQSAIANQAGGQAWTESTSGEEVEALVDYGIAQGYIEFADSAGFIKLTIDGWRALEELDQSGVILAQGFVAMWFGPDVTDAYENGIAPAIRESGYAPMRIDQKEHSNRIDDEIIAEIRRSRFVVADFTCGTVTEEGTVIAIPRGGVYYEAGFAQGLGIPVIWMCRQDHIDHVHFDTRQFNHITWKDAEDLKEKLRNRIGAVLGDGPNIVR